MKSHTVEIWLNVNAVFLSDGDLITIFDSSDLSFAIQCSRILKLTLFGMLNLFIYVYFSYLCCPSLGPCSQVDEPNIA